MTKEQRLTKIIDRLTQDAHILKKGTIEHTKVYNECVERINELSSLVGYKAKGVGCEAN